jgi:hypothetical protein
MLHKPLRSCVINSQVSLLVLAVWTLSLDTTLAFTARLANARQGRFQQLYSVTPDISAEEAFARTQAHLKKLQQRHPGAPPVLDDDDKNWHPQQKQSIAQETLYQKYIILKRTKTGFGKTPGTP